MSNASTVAIKTPTFEPEFRDYLRLNFHVTIRRMKFLCVLSCLLLVAFLASPWMPMEGDLSPTQKFWAARYLLFLPVMCFVLLPVLTYFAAKKRWIAAVELRDPRSYEFDERGIKITAASFVSDTSWTTIVAAESIGNLIGMRTAQHLYYLVPRSVVPEDRVAPLLDLIRLRVRDTARLK